MHLETIDAAARFEVSSNEFASLASGLSTDRHHGELPSIHLELCLDRASRKRIEMHLHPQRYPILFQLGFPENKGSSRCSTSNSILGSSWAGLSARRWIHVRYGRNRDQKTPAVFWCTELRYYPSFLNMQVCKFQRDLRQHWSENLRIYRLRTKMHSHRHVLLCICPRSLQGYHMISPKDNCHVFTAALGAQMDLKEHLTVERNRFEQIFCRPCKDIAQRNMINMSCCSSTSKASTFTSPGAISCSWTMKRRAS